MIVAIVTLLVLAVGIGLVSARVGKWPGELLLSESEFDFGSIPNSASVTHVLKVRNAGRGPLEITGISTSCGCTTATVADENLPAGEETDLTITFDPLSHDGATGEFMRLVYVRSTDPDTPEATVTVRVTVVEGK